MPSAARRRTGAGAQDRSWMPPVVMPSGQRTGIVSGHRRDGGCRVPQRRRACSNPPAVWVAFHARNGEHAGMRPTVVDLVTPHLLRIVDLANEAQKGVNVHWHLSDAVNRSMAGMADQYNASTLVAAYVEGLESLVAQAPPAREDYLRVLKTAVDAARRLRRD